MRDNRLVINGQKWEISYLSSRFSHQPENLRFSGFTLLELLIVVAIMGIITAIGVRQFQGYQAQTKINVSKTNHKTAASLLLGSYSGCSAGIGSVTLGTATVPCTNTAAQFASAIKTYFDAVGMENPYDLSSAITVSSAGTTEGETYLDVSSSTTTITTNVTSSETLVSVVVKE